MTNVYRGLRLYIEDRVLRRSSDAIVRSYVATARSKGRKPKQYIKGATLISQDDLRHYVKNYRGLLHKRGTQKSFDEWVSVVMNRPTFVTFIGNCEFLHQLRPVYDAGKRQIVLLPVGSVNP